MVGNLVIVESPAKAKTIQKYLGNEYVVKPSFGHIRDLSEKKLGIDVEHGFTPEYEVPAGKKKTVTELKKLASGAGMVWLASDEDREGEAISWHLAETLGLDPTRTRRIAFHEITRPAIEKAIQNPRDIDMDLVNAQQARRVLDRLVGFELSPVLWRKINRGLSAGRVQSVALRLVVDREREIMNFKPEAYYRIDGEFLHCGSILKATAGTRFEGIDAAESFLEDCKNSVFTVGDIEKKEGTRMPAAPFTTSTLQQEASRKLHFSVSQTMRLAQSLYERGLITYMRTDSTNLSVLAVGEAKKFISANYGEDYSRPRQFKTKSMGAQEAHEAIRPTFISNVEIEGSPQEQKLYNLIWKRTVASQMAEAKILNTAVRINTDKRSEQFCANASEVLFDGFLRLYLESTDDEDNSEDLAVLPVLHTGDRLEIGSISASCKYTQAPFRFSEATLVKKLEELGIGRPSTYAPTIDTLTKARGYLVKGDKTGTKVEVENLLLKNGRITTSAKIETVGAEKGKLLPQEIGLIVTDYLVANFSEILNYDFTANVEKDFDRIAEGEAAWNEVISDFYTPFHNRVNESMSSKDYTRVSRELGVDPSDGQVLVAKFGPYGPFVQKGEGENRRFANLAKGQLIENITLEDALNLFKLPRTVGKYGEADIIVTKGPYGPYIKWGDKNIKMERGTDPVNVTLEECVRLIDSAISKAATPVEKIHDFTASGISVINGRYGPYIKQDGKNYKIPAGKDAASLTEEDCLQIISTAIPTAGKRFSRFKKK